MVRAVRKLPDVRVTGVRVMRRSTDQNITRRSRGGDGGDDGAGGEGGPRPRTSTEVRAREANAVLEIQKHTRRFAVQRRARRRAQADK